jgi:hypothetical protein
MKLYDSEKIGECIFCGTETEMKYSPRKPVCVDCGAYRYAKETKHPELPHVNTRRNICGRKILPKELRKKRPHSETFYVEEWKVKRIGKKALHRLFNAYLDEIINEII